MQNIHVLLQLAVSEREDKLDYNYPIPQTMYTMCAKVKLCAAKEWCRVSSVGSVSAFRTVGGEFASRPGHTKDHHKNGTNCLPA